MMPIAARPWPLAHGRWPSIEEVWLLMILSFHPIFEGDRNIICAGRDPGADDLAAISEARVAILPQGCRASLYKMARDHCAHVFPNYDAKFRYPGKIGQIHLFRETGVPHPKTETYHSVKDFSPSSRATSHASRITYHESRLTPHASRLTHHISRLTPHASRLTPHASRITHHASRLTSHASRITFPFVFKFDWGGEGENVFLISSARELEEVLGKAISFEKTGQSGFLIQEYVPSQNRTLRVVIIGDERLSYWRVQPDKAEFCANLAKGAVTDADADPDLQAEARASAKAFCNRTGINLAGFDFLFSNDEVRRPLFLEINYFFGRTGLGGSEKFYELLNRAIGKWIDGR